MDVSQKRIVALITGASRGFGQSVTKALTTALVSRDIASLTLLLHARPTSHEKISALAASLTSHHGHTKINVTPLLFDLHDAEAFVRVESVLKDAVAHADFAFLFNNAGTLHSAKVGTSSFAQVLRESLEINTVAPALLADVFARVVPSMCVKRVVLTSSVVALQPFKSWGGYCSSKAATQMIHQVLAAESDVRVLCYAPGVMVSDMTADVAANDDTDPELKAHLQQLISSQRLVDPNESASKLLSLLLQDEYQSGEQIDFYDV